MEDYKQKTVDSYNKNIKKITEKFTKLTDVQRRYEFNRFIELLKGKKILDLGCGGGDHAQYFKEQELDVTAIDLSEEMIKICKQKGLNAIQMDIEKLEFEDNAFDGIWAVTSLLHVPKTKIDSVLQKLNKILKKEGILYVCLKEGEGEKMINDQSGNRFFAFWTQEEMKLFQKYFELIELKKAQVNQTTFIQAFYKKN